MISQQDIGSLLKSLYQNKSMAHFYLIEPQFEDHDHNLKSFLENFLKEVGATNPFDHPDILWQKPTEKKHFLKEEMQPIYEFLKYPALNLNRKFLVIEDIAKISELWTNKLLKEFEEPSIEITIFVTNPNKSDVIATLRSRSHLIRLPIPTNLKDSLSDSILQSDYKTLCQNHLNDVTNMKVFLAMLGETLQKKNSPYEALEEFKQLNSAVIKDIQYNNPLQHSQFRVFTFLQKTLK